MNFCIKCGTQLEADDVFCGNCGQPVEVSASVPTVKPSIDVKKTFIDYLKYPVSTIKNLVFSLDVKFTAILCAVIVLLTAYVPFKPIRSAASLFTAGLGTLGGDLSLASGIKSKINELYFSFLLYTIFFFAVGAVLVLVYGTVRGRKESFLRALNLFVLCSIPAVLFMTLSAFIFGLNSFSLTLILFGFILSGVLLYSQFKEVLALSDLDSFIALVVVNVLSYGTTFYFAFTALKAKIESFENFF